MPTTSLPVAMHRAEIIASSDASLVVPSLIAARERASLAEFVFA
jgi:hypothetical protein